MTGQRPQRPPSEPRLAVFVALVQTLGTAIAARGEPGSPGPIGYGLLAFSGLVLADRDRSPRPVAVVVAAATVAYHLRHYPSGPTFVAAFVAAAAAMNAGRGGAAVGIGALGYGTWVLLGHPTPRWALIVAGIVAGLGLFAAFVLFASRSLRQEQKLDQERRARRVTDERLRIAQELHDVLGHHLSLINVRAGVGLHLMDQQPDQARTALDTIKHASAAALREVRSVLDTLYPTGQAAPRAPAPGLAQLSGLTEDAGLPVRTTVTGDLGALPGEVDRAAYRIVQEALTNIRRHAGPGAAATIAIEHRRGELELRIADDGGAGAPIEAAPEPGNGISGMRERTRSLGGTLVAAPLPGGGWQVAAVIPVPDGSVADGPVPDGPVADGAAPADGAVPAGGTAGDGPAVVESGRGEGA